MRPRGSWPAPCWTSGWRAARGLDMGSGTGVLAIVAAKCGAAHVDAVDIDDWADANCRENVAANGVADRVSPMLGDVRRIAGRRYDFILANINRNILAADMPAYAAALAAGGDLVMSGFLEADLPAIAGRRARGADARRERLPRRVDAGARPAAVTDSAFPIVKTYKGRGIVLHTLKYGDSSMVVYLLTDVGGTAQLHGPGGSAAAAAGFERSALFQPVFPVEFEGLESPRQEMHRFREVRAGFALQSLPFDVRKSTMALFMAEVLYRLVRECEPNEPLFTFVWNSVGALDAMREGVANFHLWFLANLSRLLGYRPGNDYTPGAWFDIREGEYASVRPPHPGVMSQECARLLDEPAALRRAPSGDDSAQPCAAFGLSERHARLFRLPPRRHQRRAVGPHTKRGILTFEIERRRL